MIDEDNLDSLLKTTELFYSLKNKSIAFLVNESGIKEKGEYSVKRIKGKLQTNPKIADSWIMWSEDKRTDKGWYILEEDNKWEVGYIKNRVHSFWKKRTFKDKISACAYFINKETQSIIDNINKRKQEGKGLSL